MLKTVILTIVSVIICTNVFAQRTELKKRCNEITDLLKGNAPFHIQYTLAVKGKGDNAEEGSIKMNFYKSGDNEDFMAGDYQEIIHTSKRLFLVNHMQKVIVIQEDTLSKLDTTSNKFLYDLNEFVDSALAVNSHKKNGCLSYVLEYPSGYIYKKVEFSFNTATHQLSSLYAEFSEDYPEPYASMKVNYDVWDTSWQPGNNFPDIRKYVVLSGNNYEVQNNYKNYKIYQPGTLKY